MDQRGYLYPGVYQGAGYVFGGTRIQDDRTAVPAQSTPTMAGRDVLEVRAEEEDGRELLDFNGAKFIGEEDISETAAISGTVTIGEKGYAQWYRISDSDAGTMFELQ